MQMNATHYHSIYLPDCTVELPQAPSAESMRPQTTAFAIALVGFGVIGLANRLLLSLLS